MSARFFVVSTSERETLNPLLDINDPSLLVFKCCPCVFLEYIASCLFVSALFMSFTYSNFEETSYGVPSMFDMVTFVTTYFLSLNEIFEAPSASRRLLVVLK